MFNEYSIPFISLEETMPSKINEPINPIEGILNHSFWRKRQLSNFFTVFVFTAIFLSGLFQVQDSFAGEAWVANMKGANVQIIDTDSNQVFKTIETGAGAHNVTFSPDGKLAYIANLGTNSITIIDAVSKKKLADVLTDTKAHDVAVSPDGKTAVSSNVGAGNVTFIDVASKKVTHTIPTGVKAITAIFSPDGNDLYVVNAGDATISVIDVNTQTISKTIPGAKGAMAIKPNSDWSLLSPLLLIINYF